MAWAAVEGTWVGDILEIVVVSGKEVKCCDGWVVVISVLVTFHVAALDTYHSTFVRVCFGYFGMLLPLLD